MTDPRDPSDDVPTLAQEGDEHGRIGYGRYARYSPVGLALLIVILVVAVLWKGDNDAPEGSGALNGRPAPDVTLTTFSGNTVRLADLRGSVVVVNFWAEWCAPCREEMPALQAVADAAIASGGGVVVIGVNIKNDWPEKSRPFAESLGITYAIGQDVGGDAPLHGPIELAFGIDPNYPTTVFISPDGTIHSVRLGEMDEAEIRQRIDDARG